jgi:serralysin
MRIHPFLRLLPIAALAFTACQKEPLPQATTTEAPEEICPGLTGNLARLAATNPEEKTERLLSWFTLEQIADLRANTCLAVDPPDGYDFSAGVEDRGAGLKNAFWTPGQTIRVRFLNGSAALQNKVFAQARTWENFADIHFKKVTGGASEVRILFATDGHWSYIGTGNANVDACEETMSLELNDQSADPEIRRVALHEFGHVLGLRHEHQQPLASIPWNASAVYAYYAQQDWSKQEVDEQVLNKNSAESTQNTTFDPQSIMQYPVAAALTTNGFSIPWNSQLSAMDKSFIGMMYSSERIRIRHAATGAGNVTFQLNGIYHTVKPGEGLLAPAYTTGNQLAIQEASGWDSAYQPVYGKNYKIVRGASSGDLTLILE